MAFSLGFGASKSKSKSRSKSELSELIKGTTETTELGIGVNEMESLLSELFSKSGEEITAEKSKTAESVIGTTATDQAMTSSEQMSGSTTLSGTRATSETSAESGLSSTTGTTSESVLASQQTAALGEESLAELQGLILQLTGSLEADLDVTSLQDASIASVLEAGMSKVLNLGTSANAYDDTATAQAGEKLASRAAVEGTKVAVDAKLQQQQQNTNLVNAIAGLFGVEKGAVSEATTQEQAVGTQAQTAAQQKTGTTIGSEAFAEAGTQQTQTELQQATTATTAEQQARTGVTETIGEKLSTEIGESMASKIGSEIMAQLQVSTETMEREREATQKTRGKKSGSEMSIKGSLEG